MRFRVCAVALVLSSLASGLSGCGGGSSTSGTTTNLQGSYEGTFSGTLNGNADTGTLSGSLASNGNFTGKAYDNNANADATVTGTISNTGVFATTFVYPNATYTVTGMVAKTSAGHLIGTLTEFSGTTNIGTITVDLSPD